MKNRFIFLLAGITLYVLLFYLRLPGLNFLIFSMAWWMILGMLYWKHHWSWKTWSLLSLSLMSGVFVLYYGTWFTAVVNVFFLSVSSVAFIHKGSLLTLIGMTVFNVSLAPYSMYLQVPRIFRGGSKLKRILWPAVISMIIGVIFLQIYRSASVLFDHFVRDLEIGISAGFIRFILLGLLLIFPMIFVKKSRMITAFESSAGVYVSPRPHFRSWFGKSFTIENEFTTGTISFVLLNLMLLLVNLLDLNFLFGDQVLPEGLTYSAFVHQGVGMIIFSVLAAIAVILYFFRGELNFFHKVPVLRILSLIWIFQNFIMVLSCISRNDMYIDAYGLTFFRIGVYVFLGLTLFGLITVLLKVLKKYTNYMLFRLNAWSFFVVLMVIPAFNWPVIVTRYNLENLSDPDLGYLASLPDANLPLLVEYAKVTGTDIFSVMENSEPWEGQQVSVFERAETFVKNYDADFRSFSFGRKQVYEELSNLNKQ